MLEKIREKVAKANDGRGISCAEGIMATYEQGDIAGARRWFLLDGDKLRQYPEIREQLGELLSDESWGKKQDWLGTCWGALEDEPG